MISARRQDAASALEQEDNLCVCLRVFAYVVLRCHQKGERSSFLGVCSSSFGYLEEARHDLLHNTGNAVRGILKPNAETWDCSHL